MELRVLGPVELVIDGRAIYLERRQQRLILGILAVEANRFVSRKRLINLVWGANPPQQASGILQTRVSEMRSALKERLGSTSFLVSRDGGYLLTISPELVDLHKFRRLVREARNADSDEDARQLLLEARDLWRGPFLEGSLQSGLYDAIGAGPEKARLTADEDLWEVELRLGNHHLIVDEISEVAAGNPGRERLVGLAMTALRRSGRRAEALQHFENCQLLLAAEFGVAPSPELRAIYMATLEHTDLPLTRRDQVCRGRAEHVP